MHTITKPFMLSKGNNSCNTTDMLTTFQDYHHIIVKHIHYKSMQFNLVHHLLNSSLYHV